MLPGPTTLLSRAARLLRRGGALLAAVLLLVGLSACSGLAQPSQKVLLSALALQIDLTQRSIADALSLAAASANTVANMAQGQTIEITGQSITASGASNPIRRF